MQKTRKLSKWLVLPLLVMFVATLLVCSLPTNARAENGYTHLDIYTNGVLDNNSYTVYNALGLPPVGFEACHWNIPNGFPIVVVAKDGANRTWNLDGGFWESTPAAGGGNSVTFVKDIFSGTHIVRLDATGDDIGPADPDSNPSGSAFDGSGNNGSGNSGSGNSGSGNNASGNSGSGSNASGNSGSGNSGSGSNPFNPSGSGFSGSGNNGSGKSGSGSSASGNSGSGLPGSGNSGSGSSASGNGGSGLPGSGFNGSGKSGSGLPGSGNSGSGLPGSGGGGSGKSSDPSNSDIPSPIPTPDPETTRTDPVPGGPGGTPSGGTPRTGDSNIVLWVLIVAALSAVVFVLTFAKRKRAE